MKITICDICEAKLPLASESNFVVISIGHMLGKTVDYVRHIEMCNVCFRNKWAPQNEKILAGVRISDSSTVPERE